MMVLKYIDNKGMLSLSEVTSITVDDTESVIMVYSDVGLIKIMCQNKLRCVDIVNDLYYNGRSDVSSDSSIIVEIIGYNVADIDGFIGYFSDIDDPDDYDDYED